MQMTETAIADAAAGTARPRVETLAAELLAKIARAQRASDVDPFGNPVLSVALGIARRMDDGQLDDEALWAIVRHLRDAAFADRARRLATYVGGTGRAENEAALIRVAGVVLRPDPLDSPVRWAEFREAVERTRYAAVFTAHPTFALPAEVAAALAAMACGTPPADSFASHRPQRITLEEEFAQASAAIARGRDALDRFNAALLAAARGSWPDRWTELAPRPMIMTSWVGYDTDGRTDIIWLDILRLRLRMKRRSWNAWPDSLRICRWRPRSARASPPRSRRWKRRRPPARRSRSRRRWRRSPARWSAAPSRRCTRPRRCWRCSPRRSPPPPRGAVAPVHRPRGAGGARAVAGAHSCAAECGADPQRGAPAPGHRRPAGRPGPPPRAAERASTPRSKSVQPVQVDFGALAAEQASAARLMMTVAQIVKHIDGSVPCAS